MPAALYDACDGLPFVTGYMARGVELPTMSGKDAKKNALLGQKTA